MPNVLEFRVPREKSLEKYLKKLYQEILNDNFFDFEDDLIKMAYYGQKQGEFFRLFREYQEISPEKLSQEIGLTVVEVLEIESGQYVPDEYITALYAEAIGANHEMDFFLNFFDETAINSLF